MLLPNVFTKEGRGKTARNSSWTEVIIFSVHPLLQKGTFGFFRLELLSAVTMIWLFATALLSYT